MKKKVLFIVNPRSGTRRRKEPARLAERYLDADRFSWSVAFTGHPGHAAELAREAAQKGVGIVAAVGGDGSVNEVARGILGSDARLAIIPAGSGNGLARALRIPRDMGSAIALINGLHVRNIDLGSANGHLFLSNAGAGFDALVARLFAGSTGRGFINYSRLVLRSLGEYRHKHYHLVTGDGILHRDAFFIAVANGNQFGYNFKIAPQAEPDDGWLDICIMRPLRFRDLPFVSLQALTGRLQRGPYLQHLRCRSVTITRDEPLEWMQVDGDAVPVKDNRITVELMPGALKVICP